MLLWHRQRFKDSMYTKWKQTALDRARKVRLQLNPSRIDEEEDKKRWHKNRLALEKRIRNWATDVKSKNRNGKQLSERNPSDNLRSASIELFEEHLHLQWAAYILTTACERESEFAGIGRKLKRWKELLKCKDNPYAVYAKVAEAHEKDFPETTSLVDYRAFDN